MDQKEILAEIFREDRFSFQKVKPFGESEAAENAVYRKAVERDIELGLRLRETMSEEQKELLGEKVMLREEMDKFQWHYYFMAGAGMILDALEQTFKKLDEEEKEEPGT